MPSENKPPTESATPELTAVRTHLRANWEKLQDRERPDSKAKWSEFAHFLLDMLENETKSFFASTDAAFAKEFAAYIKELMDVEQYREEARRAGATASEREEAESAGAEAGDSEPAQGDAWEGIGDLGAPQTIGGDDGAASGEVEPRDREPSPAAPAAGDRDHSVLAQLSSLVRHQGGSRMPNNLKVKESESLTKYDEILQQLKQRYKRLLILKRKRGGRMPTNLEVKESESLTKYNEKLQELKQRYKRFLILKRQKKMLGKLLAALQTLKQPEPTK
jgi:hypothetical protein